MNLDDRDRAILALAQGDLSICEEPFDEWSGKLGIPVEEIISRLQALKEKGVIRYMKAILRHKQAGFTANAMVVWAVPEPRVDEIGEKIASAAAVSHCYEREGFGRYTIFSMIHARSRDEIMKTLSTIARSVGIDDYQVFWSIKELKKSSMRYFQEEESRDE
ncbi:MAG TPA: Lrp/AsnC family transcriptional regulator [Desulfomonilia bacterium]|nr:Lrp/AsnC family transcriptional regulator [Desulfomonilia bacterium]